MIHVIDDYWSNILLLTAVVHVFNTLVEVSTYKLTTMFNFASRN